jgi:hypothetical protein
MPEPPPMVLRFLLQPELWPQSCSRRQRREQALRQTGGTSGVLVVVSCWSSGTGLTGERLIQSLELIEGTTHCVMVCDVSPGSLAHLTTPCRIGQQFRRSISHGRHIVRWHQQPGPTVQHRFSDGSHIGADSRRQAGC